MKILLKKTTRLKILLLPVLMLALSLVACSSPTKTTQTPSETDTTSSPQDTSSSQSPATAPEVATANVEELGEVTFKADTTASFSGSFDGINGSPETTHTLAKETPIKLEGWAISPESSKPADKVIVTAGEDRTVVAIAPVNIERADVEQALNQPGTKQSGWNVDINPSELPSQDVVLQAWAYNSQTKEAVLLNKEHQITIK